MAAQLTVLNSLLNIVFTAGTYYTHRGLRSSGLMTQHKLVVVYEFPRQPISPFFQQQAIFYCVYLLKPPNILCKTLTII